MKTLITLIAIILIASFVSNLFGDDHIFTLPVEGNDLRVSAGWYYPDGSGHFAVDYISSSGTGVISGRDIYSAYGGVVIQVVSTIPDNSGSGYGNYVKIDHQNGYMSLYAHMLYNSPEVSVGDIVIQGQVIGKVGNTGNSTGYHLHFQIWKNGVSVDPYGWYTIPDASGNPYSVCNDQEYYFTEITPIHAPSSSVAQRIIPDDVICHVIGTPDYYWLQNGIMNRFDCEPPFYSWSWSWDEAIEATQDEMSGFQIGSLVSMKPGTCVFDQNYERWVFDYATDTSNTIVKRRATNWQQLGYASDVWIPVSTSFMNSFNEGSELISGYPYGAVLKNGSNRYVLIKGSLIGPNYSGQKMRLQLFSDDTYNINYYHYNLNINVSESVLNNYPLVPNNMSEHIMDGKLIKGSDNRIYYLENGYKRHIQDATTFSYYGFSYASVFQVSDVDINSFPTGLPISFSPSGGSANFDGGSLDDGGFDSGLIAYWHFNDLQGVADFNISEGSCVSGTFKAEVQVNSAVNYYDVELKQLVSVISSGMYHLSFYVKSDTQTPFKLEIIKDTSPWNNYGLWKELVATNVWQKYQYIFIINSTDDFARLTFEIGEFPGRIYFDEIVFEKVRDIEYVNHNMIANGDFELNHFAPWFVEDINSCAIYYTDNVNYHSGNVSMYIDPNQSSNHWEVQIRQNISVEEGETYEVSFWAKASLNRNIKVELYNDGEPWNNYGLWSELNVSTSWQRYLFQFTASSTGNPRFAIYFGHQDIPVWIDDIIVCPARVSNEDLLIPEADLCVYQNTPNPFKCSTNISYQIKSRNAKLEIYNIKGQIVKELVLDASKGFVSWDGSDKNNIKVASGIYFYTICDGVKNLPLKKMIYLK